MSNEKIKTKNSSTPDGKITLEEYSTYPDNLKLHENYDVLVLSGGGTKGVILLGMLHRLINKKLSLTDDTFLNNQQNNKLSYIKSFIGTSIGSIICFLLIIGFTPIEIMSSVCTKNFSIDTKINIRQLLSTCGLMSFETFFDEIHTLTEKKIGYIPTMYELYESYNKEFTCVTYNITTDETIYIDHISHPNLSCLEALKMSCNVPVIFEKYMYDKCFYVDGAVADNFAIKYASNRYKNSKILGLYIEQHIPRIREDKNEDIMSYIKILLTLSFRMNCKKSKNFRANNIHSIMATINENNPEWNPSNSIKFEYFSIGYKLLDEIEIQSKVKIKID